MTRLVVPASRYFSGVHSDSKAKPTMRPSGLATSAAVARSVMRASSGALVAQRSARETFNLQLKEELERSHQRQVQGILATFDR